MDEGRLAAALTGLLGASLARELCADFVKVRQDALTLTLERASPGKFVETFVQCLQYMASGRYDVKPEVDSYLSKQAENETAIPEGLRLCASRIARSIYTLRNKRNIAHKNPVDPNRFDLAMVHQGAAWITAEFLRNATGTSMEEAGALIELVQVPVGTLVEEIDGTFLVHAKTSTVDEILILLHSQYPDRLLTADILKSMGGRSAKAVKNRLGEMKLDKLIHGDAKLGFRLTQTGYSSAVDVIRTLTAKQ